MLLSRGPPGLLQTYLALAGTQFSHRSLTLVVLRAGGEP